MKRLLALLLLVLPVIAGAGEYRSSLVVQTGEMRESDLIIRNISDLDSRRTCLVFYIRTVGTSPVMTCYDATSGFGANINQIAHLKVKELVVRVVEDSKNKRICLVAYISTPGASPSVACYTRQQHRKGGIVEEGHLREGDLEVYRVVDGPKSCLIAYVTTKGTSPSVACFDSKVGGKGGLRQLSYLREGDLVVRKIADFANAKSCMVTYVSTQGTSSHLYCYDE